MSFIDLLHLVVYQGILVTLGTNPLLRFFPPEKEGDWVAFDN
jgi:hypothetical protein